MIKINSDYASSVGIEYYSTDSEGIGGEIKRRISDFVVEEVDTENRVAEVKAFKSDKKLEIPVDMPEKNAEYLVAELEKFNMDQMLALRIIARWLQSSRYIIGFAGTKDKRAITSQFISLKLNDAERLKSFKSRYISIRPLRWQDNGIEIGCLKGNRFTVTIRKIEGLNEKEIEKRIRLCFEQMEKGIVNYFGSQRFGGNRGITHIVGKSFIKGDFKKGVIDYLCSPSENEEESVIEARRNLKESLDYSRASKEFPVKYRYERAIIHHLCKYPNDYVNAFGKLPKSLRYMFTHAYQSYLFNKAISMRLEKGYGLEKMEDDVLDEEGNPTAALFGFESKIPEGRQGEIEKSILEEEGIKLEEFHIKKMPELSSKGARRSILLKPENMEFLGASDDEFNEGMKKAALRFYLPKGGYATIVLGEIIKRGLLQ